MGDLLPFRPRGSHAAHEPVQPRMYCVGCGSDRTIPSTAADPGPCPYCGSTMRSSTGKPVPVIVAAGPGVQVTITGVSGFEGGVPPPYPVS